MPNTKEILKKVDHTLLSQAATWEDIKTVLDDAVKYDTASACIPPAYVKQAAEYLKKKGSSLPVCTVIGFPNGYNTTAVKVYETKDAIKNGASEIDMVINIGMLKDKKYDDIKKEIRAIHEACDGKVLKVIIGMLQSSTDEQAGIPNLRFYNSFREMRQDMSYTGASGGKANGNPVIKEKPKKGNFLYNEKTGEYVHSVYARIVIRRKL